MRAIYILCVAPTPTHTPALKDLQRSVKGVKVKEDPDTRCTRKQTLMGQGRMRVNNQGVRKPGDHKLRYTDGRQGHRNRVETRKSVRQ